MNKKNRKKKGFTLIELIVVIAILGILAAIAVPRFAGMQDRAKVKSDYSSAAMIGNAAQSALAEGKISSSSTNAAIKTALTSDNYIANWPTPAFKSSGTFVAHYDATSNDIEVYYSADDTALTTKLYPAPTTIPDSY